MTKEEWVRTCAAALESKGITSFHPLEIADVGRVAYASSSDDSYKWKAVLRAPTIDLLPNALMLCQLLSELRQADPVGPVLVNSWYRDVLYNHSIGGAARSMHMTGGAADVVKRGWTTSQVADWLENHPESEHFGVGRYNTFTHIDIRGKIGRAAPARWGVSD